MATDRIVLHSAIAPAFINAFKAALTAAAADAPLPPTLVSSASKERVEKLVSEALSSGAHVIHGPAVTNGDHVNGTETKGVHMAPTVLGGTNESMRIWQDESFASLAACIVVDSDDEAVAVANRGGYGLSAAIFTEDLRKGFKLAKRIESG